MRQCLAARDANPALTGLRAIGGFGSLPARYALTLLSEETCPMLVEAELRRIGTDWQDTNLTDDEVRETFLLLAGEFDGTAADLLQASAFLKKT